MIAGDDPTPWNLLHDGTLTEIVRFGDRARLTVEIPFVRRRFEPRGDAFVIELHGVSSLTWLPYSDRWDEPEIDDLAAIVAAEPNFAEAQWRDSKMIVWGSLGSLRLVYAGLEIALAEDRPVSLDQLGEAVAGYWREWRAHWAGWDVHPLVHAATREPWTNELLVRLIDAWRSERTSDLAQTIAIVDEGLRGPPPVELADEADVERWCASWTSAPGAALDELARRARASWDVVLGDADIDERLRASATIWDRLRRCVAALEHAPPDPRIGRAIEAMLRGPSDAWFRVDQVHHAIDRFEPPPEQIGVPSFADHALALLDVHGDAGSVVRLRETAGRLLIEADCNTAEMSERLTTLAEPMAGRWPRDRPLPDAVEQALRHHSIVS